MLGGDVSGNRIVEVELASLGQPQHGGCDEGLGVARHADWRRGGHGDTGVWIGQSGRAFPVQLQIGYVDTQGCRRQVR
jgi:hypothetical protein